MRKRGILFLICISVLAFSCSKQGENSKYGYIDRTGKIVIKPQFDLTFSFSEGLASVKIGDKYGYIDKTGKIVINPEFDDAEEFSEGLAKVKIELFGKELSRKIGGSFGNWGYIDRKGSYIIKPQFYRASSFSEGLANVEKVANVFLLIDGKKKYYDYIDRTGKIVFELQAHSAENFSEGLAMVRIDGKCGYIDKTGKIVIKPQFKLRWHLEYSPFSEGLARVWIGGVPIGGDK